MRLPSSTVAGSGFAFSPQGQGASQSRFSGCIEGNLLEENQIRDKCKDALHQKPSKCGASTWITVNKSPFLYKLVCAKLQALSHHLFSILFPFSALFCSRPWILHPSREGEKTGMTQVTRKPQHQTAASALHVGNLLKIPTQTTFQAWKPNQWTISLHL